MESSGRKPAKPVMTEADNKARSVSELELRYHTLFEQSPDGILIIGTDGKILDFNGAAHRQLGYSREEFAGLHLSDIDPVETPEDVQARIGKLLKGERTEFEVSHRTKEGETRDVQVITRAIVLSGKTVLHTIWRDITVQKQAEQSIRRSEEKFRTLFESATDAIFILDLDGNFADINRTAHERLGYTKEEMLSMHLSQLDPPEFAAMISDRIRYLVKHGRAVFESAHMRKDGSVMPVEMNARIIDYDGGKAIFSIIRDITDRKQAEEELEDLNAGLQALIRAIPDLVAFKDTNGRHLIVNKALEEFTGLSQSELIGKTNRDLLPPGLAESCDRSDRKVLESLKPLHYEEHYSGNGGEKRFFDTIKAPIFDGPRKVAGIVTVSREITDRKEIEEQIKASLKEKEILLKEIHHRVKNNLNVIASLLNLQARCSADAETVDIFRDCQHRIKSMSLIHEKLYERGDLLKINFREYVTSLLVSLSSLYVDPKCNIKVNRHIAEIALDIDTSIPCGLIINELVTNSMKHAFTGRTEGQISVSFHASRGNCALSVRDDGIGLQENFDPADSKTLGLQLVHILTQQLGGNLEIIVNDGSEFRIFFDAPRSKMEV